MLGECYLCVHVWRVHTSDTFWFHFFLQQQQQQKWHHVNAVMTWPCTTLLFRIFVDVDIWWIRSRWFIEWFATTSKLLRLENFPGLLELIASPFHWGCHFSDVGVFTFSATWPSDTIIWPIATNGGNTWIPHHAYWKQISWLHTTGYDRCRTVECTAEITHKIPRHEMRIEIGARGFSARDWISFLSSILIWLVRIFISDSASTY